MLIVPLCIKGLFELLHAGIDDLRFLTRSAVDPKYCPLIVDLPLRFILILKKDAFKKKVRTIL